MLFAEDYDWRIPKLFAEGGWEVLLFKEGGAGGAIDGDVELLGEGRNRLEGIDLAVCNRPSLLFKYHEAAGEGAAPVMYLENLHERARVARLIRGIAPLEQNLILSLIFPEAMVVPVGAGERRRPWWRRRSKRG
jgi:hypothetical protein